MEAPVIYGTILGIVIVLLAFCRSRTANKTPIKSPEPADSGTLGQSETPVTKRVTGCRWLGICRSA